MWEKIRVIFTIQELRNRILITLLCLAVYRIGYWITIPVVDQASIADTANASGGLAGLIKRVSVFAASNLTQATIFGLGIMPYISASIIFQLLGSFHPKIQELRKEGQAGQKKINDYTRYLTVVLCLIQSFFYVVAYLNGSDADNTMIHQNYQAVDAQGNLTGSLTWSWTLISVLIMTCGATFLMWLGEQIDEYGIGNGISLLIMAGILAVMPGALSGMFENSKFELTGIGSGVVGVETMIILALLFVAIVFGVVFITLGQRRIPMQSAKHVRGRRVYGGTRQFLPLRVNQGGVMPIIFASSLLMIPAIMFGAFAQISDPDGMQGIWNTLSTVFSPGAGFMYNAFYIAMIFFFCYFWTAITFNPKEMAENLKEYGSFIPGYRPGRHTSNYLEKVMVRITYVGAAFLAIVAEIPTIVASGLDVDFGLASFYGGTGLLIAVSVAFDLVQKIDSHLVMQNHKGLLDS